MNLTANDDRVVRNEESENLKLHRQMYERRLRLLRELDGLSERDIADQANDPSLLHVEETDPAETEK